MANNEENTRKRVLTSSDDDKHKEKQKKDPRLSSPPLEVKPQGKLKFITKLPSSPSSEDTEQSPPPLDPAARKWLEEWEIKQVLATMEPRPVEVPLNYPTTADEIFKYDPMLKEIIQAEKRETSTERELADQKLFGPFKRNSFAKTQLTVDPIRSDSVSRREMIPLTVNVNEIRPSVIVNEPEPLKSLRFASKDDPYGHIEITNPLGECGYFAEALRKMQRKMEETKMALKERIRKGKEELIKNRMQSIHLRVPSRKNIGLLCKPTSKNLVKGFNGGTKKPADQSRKSGNPNEKSKNRTDKNEKSKQKPGSSKPQHGKSRNRTGSSKHRNKKFKEKSERTVVPRGSVIRSPEKTGDKSASIESERKQNNDQNDEKLEHIVEKFENPDTRSEGSSEKPVLPSVDSKRERSVNEIKKPKRNDDGSLNKNKQSCIPLKKRTLSYKDIESSKLEKLEPRKINWGTVVDLTKKCDSPNFQEQSKRIKTTEKQSTDPSEIFKSPIGPPRGRRGISISPRKSPKEISTSPNSLRGVSISPRHGKRESISSSGGSSDATESPKEKYKHQFGTLYRSRENSTDRIQTTKISAIKCEDQTETSESSRNKSANCNESSKKSTRKSKEQRKSSDSLSITSEDQTITSESSNDESSDHREPYENSTRKTGDQKAIFDALKANSKDEITKCPTDESLNRKELSKSPKRKSKHQSESCESLKTKSNDQCKTSKSLQKIFTNQKSESKSENCGYVQTSNSSNQTDTSENSQKTFNTSSKQSENRKESERKSRERKRTSKSLKESSRDRIKTPRSQSEERRKSSKCKREKSSNLRDSSKSSTEKSKDRSQTTEAPCEKCGQKNKSSDRSQSSRSRSKTSKCKREKSRDSSKSSREKSKDRSKTNEAPEQESGDQKNKSKDRTYKSPSRNLRSRSKTPEKKSKDKRKTNECSEKKSTGQRRRSRSRSESPREKSGNQKGTSKSTGVKYLGEASENPAESPGNRRESSENSKESSQNRREYSNSSRHSSHSKSPKCKSELGERISEPRGNSSDESGTSESGRKIPKISRNLKEEISSKPKNANETSKCRRNRKSTSKLRENYENEKDASKSPENSSKKRRSSLSPKKRFKSQNENYLDSVINSQHHEKTINPFQSLNERLCEKGIVEDSRVLKEKQEIVCGISESHSKKSPHFRQNYQSAYTTKISGYRREKFEYDRKNLRQLCESYEISKKCKNKDKMISFAGPSSFVHRRFYELTNISETSDASSTGAVNSSDEDLDKNFTLSLPETKSNLTKLVIEERIQNFVQMTVDRLQQGCENEFIGTPWEGTVNIEDIKEGYEFLTENFEDPSSKIKIEENSVEDEQKQIQDSNNRLQQIKSTGQKFQDIKEKTEDTDELLQKSRNKNQVFQSEIEENKRQISDRSVRDCKSRAEDSESRENNCIYTVDKVRDGGNIKEQMESLQKVTQRSTMEVMEISEENFGISENFKRNPHDSKKSGPTDFIAKEKHSEHTAINLIQQNNNIHLRARNLNELVEPEELNRNVREKTLQNSLREGFADTKEKTVDSRQTSSEQLEMVSSCEETSEDLKERNAIPREESSASIDNVADSQERFSSPQDNLKILNAGLSDSNILTLESFEKYANSRKNSPESIKNTNITQRKSFCESSVSPKNRVISKDQFCRSINSGYAENTSDALANSKNLLVKSADLYASSEDLQEDSKAAEENYRDSIYSEENVSQSPKSPEDENSIVKITNARKRYVESKTGLETSEDFEKRSRSCSEKSFDSKGRCVNIQERAECLHESVTHSRKGSVDSVSENQRNISEDSRESEYAQEKIESSRESSKITIEELLYLQQKAIYKNLKMINSLRTNCDFLLGKYREPVETSQNSNKAYKDLKVNKQKSSDQSVKSEEVIRKDEEHQDINRRSLEFTPSPLNSAIRDQSVVRQLQANLWNSYEAHMTQISPFHVDENEDMQRAILESLGQQSDVSLPRDTSFASLASEHLTLQNNWDTTAPTEMLVSPVLTPPIKMNNHDFWGTVGLRTPSTPKQLKSASRSQSILSLETSSSLRGSPVDKTSESKDILDVDLVRNIFSFLENISVSPKASEDTPRSHLEETEQETNINTPKTIRAILDNIEKTPKSSKSRPNPRSGASTTLGITPTSISKKTPTSTMTPSSKIPQAPSYATTPKSKSSETSPTPKLTPTFEKTPRSETTSISRNTPSSVRARTPNSAKLPLNFNLLTSNTASSHQLTSRSLRFEESPITTTNQNRIQPWVDLSNLRYERKFQEKVGQLKNFTVFNINGTFILRKYDEYLEEAQEGNLENTRTPTKCRKTLLNGFKEKTLDEKEKQIILKYYPHVVENRVDVHNFSKATLAHVDTLLPYVKNKKETLLKWSKVSFTARLNSKQLKHVKKMLNFLRFKSVSELPMKKKNFSTKGKIKLELRQRMKNKRKRKKRNDKCLARNKSLKKQGKETIENDVEGNEFTKNIEANDLNESGNMKVKERSESLKRVQEDDNQINDQKIIKRAKWDTKEESLKNTEISNLTPKIDEKREQNTIRISESSDGETSSLFVKTLNQAECRNENNQIELENYDRITQNECDKGINHNICNLLSNTNSDDQKSLNTTYQSEDSREDSHGESTTKIANDEKELSKKHNSSHTNEGYVEKTDECKGNKMNQSERNTKRQNVENEDIVVAKCNKSEVGIQELVSISERKQIEGTIKEQSNIKQNTNNQNENFVEINEFVKKIGSEPVKQNTNRSIELNKIETGEEKESESDKQNCENNEKQTKGLEKTQNEETNTKEKFRNDENNYQDENKSLKGNISIVLKEHSYSTPKLWKPRKNSSDEGSSNDKMWLDGDEEKIQKWADELRRENLKVLNFYKRKRERQEIEMEIKRMRISNQHVSEPSNIRKHKLAKTKIGRLIKTKINRKSRELLKTFLKRKYHEKEKFWTMENLVYGTISHVKEKSFRKLSALTLKKYLQNLEPDDLAFVNLQNKKAKDFSLKGENVRNVMYVDCIWRYQPGLLDTFSDPITQLAFSDNGTYLVCCTNDMLLLYDTSKQQYSLIPNKCWNVNLIVHVGFDKRSQYLYYATDEGNVSFMNVDKGMSFRCNFIKTEEYRIFNHIDMTQSFQVLLGDTMGIVMIGDVTQNCVIYNRKADEEVVNSCAFIDGGYNIFVTAGNETVVKLWDKRVNNLMPVGMFLGHKNSPWYVESKGDEGYFITSGTDGCVKLWDKRYYSRTKCADIYSWTISKGNFIGKCHFSNALSGRRYISCGTDGSSYMIIDSASGQYNGMFNLHRYTFCDLAWHPLRSEYVTCAEDCKIYLWYDNKYKDAYNFLGYDEEIDEYMNQYV